MSQGTEPIVVGDTATFQLTARKDGAIWDISGATVSLRLRKPDGTVLTPLDASITDGPAGVARYTTDTDLLDSVGDWRRQWTVSKSGVVLSSQSVNFAVLDLMEVSA